MILKMCTYTGRCFQEITNHTLVIPLSHIMNSSLYWITINSNKLDSSCKDARLLLPSVYFTAFLVCFRQKKKYLRSFEPSELERKLYFRKGNSGTWHCIRGVSV